MQGLMLHCGGEPATIADLGLVPIPKATATYAPVPHVDLVELLRERVEDLVDMPILRQGYGLNREGRQLFGVITLDAGDTQSALSIGVRNSYDKSLSVGVSLGASVFVCDNLCFSGSDVTVLRKHTTNVWVDILDQVDTALLKAADAHKAITEDFATMAAVEVDERAGYEALGLAFGTRVISGQQLKVAVNDWRRPRHEVFADRNAWSLYNCLTEALKLGDAGGRIARQVRTHAFMMDEIVALS